MKILIVAADFYRNITDVLLTGAKSALDGQDIDYDIIEVSGALEIPIVIKLAKDKYDGFVALGCVIRGETSHYDIVCEQSAAGIMRLSLDYDLPIGNGILTVENETQALERATHKGEFVVNAVLDIIKIKTNIL